MKSELARFLQRYVLTGARCAANLTYGVFSSRGRQQLKSLAKIYGIDQPVCEVPGIELAEIAPDTTSFEVHQLRHHPYNVTNFELVVIDRIVSHLQPRAIFEFGTFDGRTTLNMAANSPDHTRIVTIDVSPDEKTFADGSTVGSRLADSPYGQRIRQLYGNSLTFDFSDYYGQFDFAFIDAGHSYECVINDSQVARRLLRKSGGILLWHDYSTIHGVNEALNELYRSGDIWRDIRHIHGTSMACLILDLRDS